MAQTHCATLGGQMSFDPISSSSASANWGSTRDKNAKHGTANTWRNWQGGGSLKAGIAGRAPYNIGAPKTAPSLGGNKNHNTGLNLGAHGHGIGVVSAALGGAHNARSFWQSATITRKSGDPTLQPVKFCFKCAASWAAIVTVVIVILIIGGR